MPSTIRYSAPTIFIATNNGGIEASTAPTPSATSTTTNSCATRLPAMVAAVPWLPYRTVFRMTRSTLGPGDSVVTR